MEFFAEWGVQVEGKLTDDPEVIQFMIKFDAKKRKDVHKKDEAIQFDFNIANDDPNVVVKEMVRMDIARRLCSKVFFSLVSVQKS